MLLVNRRLFCLSTTVLLTGCGFQPVYGPNGSAEALRGSILIDEPNDKNSYDLTNNLVDRIGSANSPRFGLSYVIVTEVDALAITQAQETTRYNVLGKVAFALRDLSSDAVLTKGTAENFTSFGATSNTVSTRSAREDAFERLMVILANDITEHLILNSESFLP